MEWKIKKQMTKQEILQYVNNKINPYHKQGHKINETSNDIFYDIQLSTKKNPMQNITEVFKNSNRIQVQNLRIVATTNKLIDYENQLAKCNQNLQQFKKTIKKDIQSIEKDNMIDIAFLYSQPLMKNSISKAQQAVGYLAEIKKLQEKILNNRSNIKRSMKIQIHVFTIQNLEKVLEQGVKFLHIATHGQQNYFQIQKSSKIGFLDNLDYKNLVQRLEKKPPQLIVFNCCLSFDIAKNVFEHFDRKEKSKNKPVITLGYQYKVDNRQCEFISEILYMQILQQLQFKQIYKNLNQKLKIKRQTCEKNLPYKPNIFFNKDVQIVLFKKQKIKENQKYVEILKNLDLKKTQDERKKIIKINQKVLLKPQMNRLIKVYYTFIQRLLQKYEGIVNVFGLQDENFVQKSIQYLWQRKRIQKKLIFNCRDQENNYQIQSALQFRCKFKAQLQRSNIQERQKNTDIKQNLKKIKKIKIVVIKNCQKLLNFRQVRQFFNVISFFMKKFAPNILVIVSKQKFTKQHSPNQRSQTFNFADQYKINIKKPKQVLGQQNKILQQNQQKAAKEISQIFQRQYINYAKDFAKRKGVQFLEYIPLINLFPQHLFKANQVQEKQSFNILRENYEQTYKYVQNKIYKLVRDRNLEKTNEQQVDTIFKFLHYLAGFNYFQFKDQGSRHKEKCQQCIYRLINLCLQIKVKQPSFLKQLKNFQQFQIKMTYLIYVLYIDTQFDSSVQVINQIKDTLRARFKEINFAQQSYTVKRIFNYWEQFRNIHQDIKKKADISDFQYKKYEAYFEQILSIKGNIQKQKQKQNNKLSYRLLTEQDAHFFILPILSVLREDVLRQQMSNSLFNDCVHIEKLNQILENFKFLQKKEKNDIFEDINKYYISIYIDLKADIQKLKLKHKEYFNYIDQIKSIERFNQWIQLCQKYELKQQLKNYLQKQKYIVFNLFLIMESQPENLKDKISQMFKQLKRDIFFRFQTFSVNKFKEYQKLKISIPISLFIFDVEEQDQNYYIEQPKNKKDQKPQKVLIKNLFLNFDGYIGIFCGKNSKKIRKVLNNFKFCIAIEIDTYRFKQQILQLFYIQFCETMFQIHGKRKLSVNKLVVKSFQMALIRSKLKCLNRYAQSNFQTIDIIDKIFDDKIKIFQNLQCNRSVILPVILKKIPDRTKVN